MGLLDDLLGGLAGQGMGARPQPGSAPVGAGSSGMSSALMALMPIVLAMLSNRAGGGGAASRMGMAPDSGGGLGDVLGQILGGANAGGGLGGLLGQLQGAGFGEQASSWVGRGANQPIPPDAMPQIFGREGLEAISRQAGLSEDETARGLSALLPEVVDHMTPEGDVPDPDALTNSVDDFARRLGIR